MQCHRGECLPCAQPCGAKRVYCDHKCEEPCHPSSECEDVPCRHKVKLSCICGLRVYEKPCGAYSAAQSQQSIVPKCVASCERPNIRPGCNTWGPKGAQQNEPEKYVTELARLGATPQHRRYVQTLEDTFYTVIGSTSNPPSAITLPPCDETRLLLAVEYARMHWRLRTSTRLDAVEGWFIVRVEPVSGARPPGLLLSEITTDPNNLLPTLGPQPRLHFSGVRGVGDEIYDLVGLEGLLGVRRGHEAGEVFAFFDRTSTASAIYSKLTGQAPVTEPVPVLSAIRSGSAWGAPPPTVGLRVVLEQTLTGVGSSGPSVALGSRTIGAAQKGGQDDGWTTKIETPKASAKLAPAEEVLDSWEDMSPLAGASDN